MKRRVIKAFIERGADGSYGVYFKDDLPVGFLGEGASAEEAIQDFKLSFDNMKEEVSGADLELLNSIEFEYHHDVPSILSYFSGIFTLAGLSRLTGINQRQLGHYLSGHRHPSETTTRKIEESLHRLSEDLRKVHLV